MNSRLENILRSRVADALTPLAIGITEPAVYINKWMIIGVILIVMPYFGFISGNLAIVNDILITSIFALSFNILLGTGRLLSFCHSIFFAFGGVITIHLLKFLENDQIFKFPIFLLPIAGGCVAMLVGMLVALVATFRGGFTFSMVSLGIGELLAASALLFSSIFGGEDGLTADRTMGMPVFGVDFADERQVYYMIAGWFLLSAWLMYRFRQSPLGIAARAVGENDERAMFIGYNPRVVRYWTFTISTFFAGIAGSLFALLFESVSSANFSVAASSAVIVKTFLGGIPFFWGPVVGSVALLLLNKLGNFTEIWALYQGFIFITFVLILPYGVTGLILLHLKFFLTWSFHCLVRPYMQMVGSLLALGTGIVGICEMWNFAKANPESEALFRFLLMDWSPGSTLPWLFFLCLAGFGAVGSYWSRKALKKHIDLVSEQEGI